VERIDFTSDLLYEDNTLDEPDRIAPVHNRFSGRGRAISAKVPAQCFTIFVITK
jgi:hypothetical protein